VNSLIQRQSGWSSGIKNEDIASSSPTEAVELQLVQSLVEQQPTISKPAIVNKVALADRLNQEMQEEQDAAMDDIALVTTQAENMRLKAEKAIASKVALADRVDQVMQEEQDATMDDIALFTTQAENMRLKAENKIMLDKFKAAQSRIAELEAIAEKTHLEQV